MALTRFALGAALAVIALPAAAQTAPVVQTAEGKVAGKRANGVSSFLGIPYGADTGGQNRFRAPKPAAPWTGTRQATAFGDRCPQPPLNKPGALIVFSELPVSENCLSLNVWSAGTARAKRPVMVWIHGGGYGFGSAADKYYDGTALAGKEGVVVVSVNHRLNGFGYLNLGPEAHGDFDTNVGQLDIVQALKWVRENIASFGGDPNNVTLFGQSGGAGKISVLLAMPAAKGLFQKAIIESGSDIHINDVAGSLAERDKVLAAFNLKPDEILKLRDMPMQALIDGFTKAGILTYHPVMDGASIPTQPYDPVANPVSANVPLLLGTAHDEATSVLANNPVWPAMTDAQLPLMAGMLTGPADVAEGIALYKSHAPADKAMHVFSSMMTDSMFTVNAMEMAERKSAQPAPVYMYRVDWHSPMRDGILRSPHGVDLPFVFDTVAQTEELVGHGPSQDRMTRLMRSSFAAFARTGNPNVKGSGYPLWPKYDVKSRAVFVFNDPPSVIHDPDADLRAYWEKVAAHKKAAGKN
jgi:para-nitrobenzyl esterase